MPKLRQTEDDKFYKNFLGNIAKQREKHGVSKDELAAALRISLSTLNNRRNAPDGYTLGELRRLSKRLHINLAELLAGA